MAKSLYLLVFILAYLQAPQAAAAGGGGGGGAGPNGGGEVAEEGAASAEAGGGVLDSSRGIMVYDVGTALPKEDFELLVREGQADKAITGMQVGRGGGEQGDGGRQGRRRGRVAGQG